MVKVRFPQNLYNKNSPNLGSSAEVRHIRLIPYVTAKSLPKGRIKVDNPDLLLTISSLKNTKWSWIFWRFFVHHSLVITTTKKAEENVDYVLRSREGTTGQTSIHATAEN